MDIGPVKVTINAARFHQLWARASWTALGLAMACALVALLAGPGYRFEFWGLGVGLQAIGWAAICAAAIFALTLIGTMMLLRKGMKRTLIIFLAAATISLLTFVPPTVLWFRAKHLPHIHDISTDTENPPRYVAVLPLRKGARNSTEYTAAVAAQQKLGYPDIAPVMLQLSAPQAFQHAERVARSMGWDIVAVESGELRIEATATTMLFGFKDDIVIRVAANGSGSRVDLRSLSRIGGSDFGTNASRIRTFSKKLLADSVD